MNRCYVLGAGFSEPCGLPLARELTQLVFAHAYPADSFQSGTGSIYLEYLCHLYRDFDLNRIWPDFEDLLTVLDEWEQYRAAYQQQVSPNDAPSLAHMRSRLIKHLGFLLYDLTASCSQEQKALIGEFIQKAAQEKSSIISFNWDLLLEIACQEQRIPISYDGMNNEELQIIKPHGSLNLAGMSREKWNESQEAINVHSVQLEWEKDDYVVARTQDPNDSKDRIIAPFENALLVEPTARKSYLSPWIQMQWQRALDIALRAKEIVVIGYSLPPTDFRPRILLQIACADRQQPFSLQIVDPIANELIERYSRFIRAEVHPINITWPEWFYGRNR